MSLREQYKSEIFPALQKELNCTNVMAVPSIEKVIVNVGIGTWRQSHKDHSFVEESIIKITGQKPQLILSRVAISNFGKLRAGQPNGLKVTLRGDRAYDFIDKLVKVVYPRVHDFRGVSDRGFDGRGNISLGLKDVAVFTEFGEEDLAKSFGIEITVVTSAKDDVGGRLLLEKMNFPFIKKK
jgi:large subunit ribosomal protein L5